MTHLPPHAFADEEQERAARSMAGHVGIELLKRRTLILSGEIDGQVAQSMISQLLLLAEKDPKKPIKMFINSPGGDVDGGFAIFDMVRFIPAPVRMISNGLTASAAVIVYVASPRDLRFTLPNARFLIHQPSMGVRGDTSDIQIEASEILKVRTKGNQLIAEETGQDVKKIEADTRRNYWMNAQEALEYGLVGKIISGKEAKLLD
jgi:ATP-dependent Clp protease protease subunit